MKKELKEYLVNEVLPLYDNDLIDLAHKQDHIIGNLTRMKKLYELSTDLSPREYDMILVAIYYHDIGIRVNRKTHHIESAKIIRDDNVLTEFFSPDEIEQIALAAQEHRASAAEPPTSKLGRYTADADRNFIIDETISRAYTYGVTHNPELTTDEHVRRVQDHMREKFGINGYIEIYTDAGKQLYSDKRKEYDAVTLSHIRDVMNLKPSPEDFKDNTEFLLSLKTKDIDKAMFIKLFSQTFKDKKIKPAMFQPNDIITITPENISTISEPTKTTVGKYIINKVTMEPFFEGKIPYFNEAITNQGLSKLHQDLIDKILIKEIRPSAFYRHLDTLTPISYYNELFVPGPSIKIITPLPSVQAEKKRLIEKYKDEIAAGNHVLVSNKIEKPLLKLAESELKDDPSFRLYQTGSKPAFGNVYKNTQIMVGPIKNLETNQFEIATNGLMEGTPIEQYELYANGAIAGSYSRGKSTAIAGAQVKFMFAGFQHMESDKAGSDCGTTRYKTRVITKANSSSVLHSFIIEGSKLVKLTKENISSYIGKTVKMRSTLFCETKKFCNKCTGDLLSEMNITSVGLLLARVPATSMQINLKINLWSLLNFFN